MYMFTYIYTPPPFLRRATCALTRSAAYIPPTASP